MKSGEIRVPQDELSTYFQQFAPRYVLGTTYTLSLAFFGPIVFACVANRTLELMELTVKAGISSWLIRAPTLRPIGGQLLPTQRRGARRSLLPRHTKLGVT